MLDRKAYVVLSDASILQNGESSQPQVTEDVMERHLDVDQDANDVPMDEDEEMAESEPESSDDELSLESTSYIDTDGDVSKVLLGLKGSRLRYKVCLHKSWVCKYSDSNASLSYRSLIYLKNFEGKLSKM